MVGFAFNHPRNDGLAGKNCGNLLQRASRTLHGEMINGFQLGKFQLYTNLQLNTNHKTTSINIISVVVSFNFHRHSRHGCQNGRLRVRITVWTSESNVQTLAFGPV
jgi:hypothetical protein